MPSGKRQLRSASSESRSNASPLASGTYIRKETPGGLQSKLILKLFVLPIGLQIMIHDASLTIFFFLWHEICEIIDCNERKLFHDWQKMLEFRVCCNVQLNL